MSITRYTTPPIALAVRNADLTGSDVYVTLEQGDIELTLTDSDLTISTSDADTIIVFSLTQEQSGAFSASASIAVQVNWIKSGVRYATAITNVRTFDNLYDEVIS